MRDHKFSWRAPRDQVIRTGTMAMLSRRSLILGTAALGASTVSAAAKAPLASTQGPGIYRRQLGDYQITALYDGLWPLPIDDKFVRNASAAEVNDALAAAFLPPRILPISFTALMVNTGRQLVLIDTGTAGQIVDSAGVLLDNLRTAGCAPADIDLVVISHFHPDHINGIRGKDGEKIFPNAQILVPEPEWAFWMDESLPGRSEGAVHHYALNARRVFRDIANEVERFTPGAQVAPGIVSIPAFGHTPGHTAFSIHSGADSLLV